jgi:hypothetical protein
LEGLPYLCSIVKRAPRTTEENGASAPGYNAKPDRFALAGGTVREASSSGLRGKVAGKLQTGRYRDRTVAITIEKQQETAAASQGRGPGRLQSGDSRSWQRTAGRRRRSKQVYDKTLSKMHFGNIARPEIPFSVTILS